MRPDCLPIAASRLVRPPVARGSMPYSAVTHPNPVPFKKLGGFSSIVGADKAKQVQCESEFDLRMATY